MRLAERRRNPKMAVTAEHQIEQALALLRAAGHAPFAQYFDAQLPIARAIRDRLQKT